MTTDSKTPAKTATEEIEAKTVTPATVHIVHAGHTPENTISLAPPHAEEASPAATQPAPDKDASDAKEPALPPPARTQYSGHRHRGHQGQDASTGQTEPIKFPSGTSSRPHISWRPWKSSARRGSTRRSRLDIPAR